MGEVEQADVAIVSEGRAKRRRGRLRWLRYIPGFSYILVMFIIGQLVFSDPRATLFNLGGYRLAWVEVLLVGAAIVAMAEQIKVAQPGVNNIYEVLLMGAVAVLQIVLFALAAAGIAPLRMFSNTEFLLLTAINTAQTVVAFQINAATLVRTISSE